MARRFGGTFDHIVFTVSSAVQSLTAGNLTIVFVANFADGTDGAMIHARTSGGTNAWWMETFGGVWNFGMGSVARNVGAPTTGSWAVYIGRKAAGGAAAPRGRKIVLGGATTDTTAPSALADGSAPGAGGVLDVGKWGTASEFIAADVAGFAIFNSDLSDATTATFTTWANIISAGPVMACHFDQANATDAISDVTGNGGNSSSITGTTIVANPSGFFSTTTVTGTGAATLGRLTGTAAGTPVVPGTAAASLGRLAGTTSGTRTVFGTGAAALERPVGTAAGTRTVLGTAAAALGGTAATASGTRTVLGTGAATLGRLAGAATSGAGVTTGTGTAALGRLTAAAAGTRTVFGTGAAALGRPVAAGAGTRTVFGTAAAALGRLTAAVAPAPTGLRGEAHGTTALVAGAVTVHTVSIAGAIN